MQGFLPIPALEAPSDGWAFLFSAAKGRPGWGALTGGSLTGFTAGLVAFGSATGGLTQDANLSYNSGTGALTLGNAGATHSIAGALGVTGSITGGAGSFTTLAASSTLNVTGAATLAGFTSTNSLNVLTSNSTNGTEFDVANTSTSGKKYAFTSWGSAAGGGSLVGGLSIYDVTAGAHRIYIHTSGRVVVNGTSDNGADNLQVAGTIAATSSIKSSDATAGIGYATGAGGTVTQATGKSTGVTLNTVCGTITLNAASLAANTSVSFTWTNSAIAATDYVDIQHDSVGTLGAYAICVTPAAGSATVTVRNNTAGALAEAIVLRFFVTKAVTS